ncbi:MAG: CPBP family intramembrane glutamic endopeptidase [Thermoproteota archaeon]
MPGFTPELRDSLILFFLLVGFLQLYYLSCYLFPMLTIYYPHGFIAHMSFYVAEFITLCLYVKFVKKSSFSDLFRRLGKWRRYCLVGFLLAIFHNVIDLTVSGGLRGFILPIYIHLPVYFLAYLLISVSEEGVFRGCILGGLLKRYGVTTSIVLSSLLFGLYHFGYPSILYGLQGAIMTASHMFYSFTVGLFLGYFYHKTAGTF